MRTNKGKNNLVMVFVFWILINPYQIINKELTPTRSNLKLIMSLYLDFDKINYVMYSKGNKDLDSPEMFVIDLWTGVDMVNFYMINKEDVKSIKDYLELKGK